MPITQSQKVPAVFDLDQESFHGCICGPVAISRLKATKKDCYLIRYSQNQEKYVLSILKRGLGQDEDNDLVMEFEIIVTDRGKRCTISGCDKSFRSVSDLLLCHQSMPLHPSIANIGSCCVSPRCKYMERMITVPQYEYYNKQIEDMKARMQSMEQNKCIIL